MYLTIDQTIVALDAATCRERWTYAWPAKDAILWRTNRGVELKDGRVIRGTSDGYLIAVDMQQGTLLWSRKLTDSKSGEFLSMPPIIVGNEVVIAPAGSEWGLKGWVGAFRLDTGEPLWRFNLIPDSTEVGADSWEVSTSREHGGGSVWTALSFDEKNDVLYVPVGNPAPDYNRDVRPGSNLYTDSVVALHVKTGRVLWYKQFQVNDSHDWDLSQVRPVFDLNIQNKSRHLIAVSGKDGLLRALDRDTRER
jgi:alcohol dehydrogenase (cytochrome c)